MKFSIRAYVVDSITQAQNIIYIMSCLKVRSDKPKTVDNEQKVDEFARNPLPYNFEKELIEKENRHIRQNYEFIPTNRVYPLERKFYALHEQNLPDYEKYLPCIEVTLNRRTQQGFPLLESQVYGWLPEILRNNSVSTLRQLNFIAAPKQRCCMTIHGEKLVAERITQRPAFNGPRFIL